MIYQIESQNILTIMRNILSLTKLTKQNIKMRSDCISLIRAKHKKVMLLRKY